MKEIVYSEFDTVEMACHKGKAQWNLDVNNGLDTSARLNPYTSLALQDAFEMGQFEAYIES